LEIKHTAEDSKEIDLEIDEENAAAATDEGSQIIKDKAEF
jgi:cytidylate kinase